MPPSISAVIPAYNAEKYIEETIDSILNQTIVIPEIIVVDDGSTDGTTKIVQKKQNLHKNIHLITQVNSGQYAARMNGIKNAQGEYIYLIDADDVCVLNGVERLYNSLSSYDDYVASYGRISGIDSDGNPYEGINPIIEKRPSGDVLRKLLIWNFMSPGGNLIRKYAFKELPDNVPINRGSDWIMWCYIAAQGKFIYVNDVILNYRIHKENLSSDIANVTDDYINWVDTIYGESAIIGNINEKELLSLKKCSHARMYSFVGTRFLKKYMYKEAYWYFKKSLSYYPWKYKRIILLILCYIHWLPNFVKKTLK